MDCGLSGREMGLRGGRGCIRSRFTPAGPLVMLPPGWRFPTPARWLRMGSVTISLSEEVPVTRGLVPRVRQGVTGKVEAQQDFVHGLSQPE